MPNRQHTVNTHPAGPRRPDPDQIRRSPAGDALTDLVLQVTHLGALFTHQGEALARPTGQTLARWVVLDAAHDHPVTVAGIARMLGLTRQSVQRLADLLEADGLATYQENPADRRARLLRVTDEGRRVLAAIRVDQKAWADRLGATVGEARLREASAVLTQLTETMREDRRHHGRRAGS